MGRALRGEGMWVGRVLGIEEEEGGGEEGEREGR